MSAPPPISLLHDEPTLDKLASAPKGGKKKAARALFKSIQEGYGYPRRRIEQMDLHEDDEWKRSKIAYIERLVQRFPSVFSGDEPNMAFEVDTEEGMDAFIGSMEGQACPGEANATASVLTTLAHVAERFRPDMFTGLGEVMRQVCAEKRAQLALIDCKYGGMSGFFGPEISVLTGVGMATYAVYAGNKHRLQLEAEREKQTADMRHHAMAMERERERADRAAGAGSSTDSAELQK